MIEKNPVKVIRNHCIECCGGNSQMARECHITDCLLHPFRLGKNPYRTKRVMSEEQKAKAVQRLRLAREKKND